MSAQSRRSRRILLITGLLVVLFSLLIVLPFITWILVGTILAYVLLPLHRRLSRPFGDTLAAGVSIFVGLLFVLIPLIVIVGVAASQAIQLWESYDAGEASQIDDLIGEILPVEADISALQDAFAGAVSTGASGLAGNLFSIVGGLPELFIGFTVLLFVLFYSLKDGDNAIAWLEKTVPLDPDVQDTLFKETDLLLYNSLVSNVAVAVAQALLVGAAFLALDISNVIFWTMTTFVAALVPLIGASIVWVPGSVYLFIVGRPISAVALFVFGAVIVSLADNIIRPRVMRSGTQLSPVLTIIGIFGGIALFGFVGLLIGPIILGMAKLIIDILVEAYPEPAVAKQA